MRMRWIALGMTALTLAGCASPAQLAEMDKDKCRGYGLKPGTEAFANCRMTLDVERQRSLRQRLDDPFFYGPPYAYGPIYYGGGGHWRHHR